MIKIGMFPANYTNKTFEILKNIFSDIKLIPIAIYADKYNNIEVDILIVNQKPSFIAASDKSPEFLCNAAIINADDKSIVKYLSKTNTGVVTYGLNSRSSVTASSILDDRAVFCIQRSFHTLNEDIVFEQEFAVNTSKRTGQTVQKNDICICNKTVTKKMTNSSVDSHEFMINCLLPAVTSALVIGASVDQIVNNIYV